MVSRLLLLFLILPIHTYSQKKIVDDVYADQPISSTRDSSKESYFHKKFEEGYVVLLNNTIKKGLVKFNGDVLFKQTKESKQQKYKAKKLASFVIDRDTFVTALVATYTLPNPNYAPSKSLNFIKQLVSGRLSLHYMLIRTISGFGYATTSSFTRNYYISNSTDGEYHLIPTKKKEFINLLSTILADDPNLVSEIKRGDLRYNDLPVIVERYNQR